MIKNILAKPKKELYHVFFSRYFQTLWIYVYYPFKDALIKEYLLYKKGIKWRFKFLYNSIIINRRYYKNNYI